MALTTAACVLIACDECEQVLENPDGGEVHFENEAQAREIALSYEWHELGAGRIVCAEHPDLIEEHGLSQPGPGAMTFTFALDTDPEVLL